VGSGLLAPGRLSSRNVVSTNPQPVTGWVTETESEYGTGRMGADNRDRAPESWRVATRDGSIGGKRFCRTAVLGIIVLFCSLLVSLSTLSPLDPSPSPFVGESGDRAGQRPFRQYPLIARSIAVVGGASTLVWLLVPGRRRDAEWLAFIAFACGALPLLAFALYPGADRARFGLWLGCGATVVALLVCGFAIWGTDDDAKSRRDPRRRTAESDE
jgi:nitrate reductase NapE component